MFDSGDSGTGVGPIGAAGTAVRDGDSSLSAIQAARKLIDNHLSGNSTAKDGKGSAGNLGFSHSFIATLSVIVVSELGDKTFFIAAIMAMRHSRTTVFAGAMCALALMHVMSAFFGYAITVIPRVLTYYISSFLFAVFGLKMIRDGWRMSPNEAQEEMEEVQEDLRKRELDAGGDLEAGTARNKGASEQSQLWAFVSKIFIQASSLAMYV